MGFRPRRLVARHDRHTGQRSRLASGPGFSALDEALQLLRAARVAELPQGLRFDLTDALARHLEVLTDLFEGVVALLADAETHAEHLLLARRQRLQHLPRLLGEIHVDDR